MFKGILVNFHIIFKKKKKGLYTVRKGTFSSAKQTLKLNPREKKAGKNNRDRENNILSTATSTLESSPFSSVGGGITDFSSATSLGGSTASVAGAGGGGSEGVSDSSFLGSSSAIQPIQINCKDYRGGRGR